LLAEFLPSFVGLALHWCYPWDVREDVCTCFL
jgi:hypothetical protein